ADAAVADDLEVAVAPAGIDDRDVPADDFARVQQAVTDQEMGQIGGGQMHAPIISAMRRLRHGSALTISAPAPRQISRSAAAALWLEGRYITSDNAACRDVRACCTQRRCTRRPRCRSRLPSWRTPAARRRRERKRCLGILRT